MQRRYGVIWTLRCVAKEWRGSADINIVMVQDE